MQFLVKFLAVVHLCMQITQTKRGADKAVKKFRSKIRGRSIELTPFWADSRAARQSIGENLCVGPFCFSRSVRESRADPLSHRSRDINRDTMIQRIYFRRTCPPAYKYWKWVSDCIFNCATDVHVDGVHLSAQSVTGIGRATRDG